MATQEVDFSISDRVTQAPIAQGTLSIDPSTNQVLGITGTVGSQTISGLSTFNGATNTVYRQNITTQLGGVVYRYEVVSIGFEAGGTSYYVQGPTPTFPLPPTGPSRLVTSDGTDVAVNASTESQFQPICFVTGARIRTSRGEVAVEDLQVGDVAVTASGTLRPITWIGHREMTAAGAALPFHQQPVRVRAGAFRQGVPARDLSLSPGHPVLIGAEADGEGGMLVPVMCLINGTTIARMPVETVTYWHVELDAHDILLAEGLPAESYIDGGDRAFFVEGSDHALHNPDFVPAGWNGRCRPVAVDGPLVEAERARLDAVFSGSLSEQCEWEPARLWCEPVSIA
ncbi:Hint domain-containing protein [Methylobacterium sp. R2-1]|uniref:Hint domain-containing protein n=1 Tax=Methylobacterium sp. R2-1 TaxID=2587064 RepID=UPI00161F1A71|nr:Hint domain-containing protein [Methylobacterium sp. R2-1]MBB2962876.1 hypothetical protein [Methylobacterium sp. R2-1]